MNIVLLIRLLFYFGKFFTIFLSNLKRSFFVFSFLNFRICYWIGQTSNKWIQIFKCIIFIIKFTIQPDKSDTNKLPSAHTCYNLLDLPLYPNADILKKKLIIAIENCTGFALV